jgi:hypothetical protein
MFYSTQRCALSVLSVCLELQKEASDVFFAATKLFQAKDPHLRRMVYLLIKVCAAGVLAAWGTAACSPF